MRHKLTPSLEYLEAAKVVVRVARDTAVIMDRPDPVAPAAPAEPDRLAELAAEYGVANSVERLLQTLARSGALSRARGERHRRHRKGSGGGGDCRRRSGGQLAVPLSVGQTDGVVALLGVVLLVTGDLDGHRLRLALDVDGRR